MALNVEGFFVGPDAPAALTWNTHRTHQHPGWFPHNLHPLTLILMAPDSLRDEAKSSRFRLAAETMWTLLGFMKVVFRFQLDLPGTRSQQL